MTSPEVNPGTNQKAGIKLTDQERGRQHLGVVGAFPAAVLEMRGQSEDVVLRSERSEFNKGPVKATFTACVSNYTKFSL